MGSAPPSEASCRTDLGPARPRRAVRAAARGRRRADRRDLVRGRAPSAELLVKYLFTSERLSIQVHPDDAAARARGYARGKDEAWYVLVGRARRGDRPRPHPPVSRRGAARGGARRQHRAAARLAAGGGRRILLFAGRHHPRDRRRPVADRDPAESRPHLPALRLRPAARAPSRRGGGGRRSRALDAARSTPVEAGPGRTILAAGGAFVLERWTARAHSRPTSPRNMLIPLAGDDAGSVWAAEGRVELAGPVDLLAAYPGGEVRDLELGA